MRIAIRAGGDFKLVKYVQYMGTHSYVMRVQSHLCLSVVEDVNPFMTSPVIIS